MNRAARRHLLAVLEARSAPLCIIRARTIDDDGQARREALRSLRDARIVLPPVATFELVQPRPAARVVAGKGWRRRGVRDRVPQLRVYKAEGMSERVRLRKWAALHGRRLAL
jgi:hypothetical protein